VIEAAQACQIFLGKTYQKGKNRPNNHKIYQMIIKCTNIFLSKALKIFWAFWALKYTIWQP
jgi:hypothetical protein